MSLAWVSLTLSCHFSQSFIASGSSLVLLNREFANDREERGEIPGQVIRITQTVVLDSPLLNTQHYKVRIKALVEQYRERSNAHLYNSVS